MWWKFMMRGVDVNGWDYFRWTWFLDPFHLWKERCSNYNEGDYITTNHDLVTHMKLMMKIICVIGLKWIWHTKCLIFNDLDCSWDWRCMLEVYSHDSFPKWWKWWYKEILTNGMMIGKNVSYWVKYEENWTLKL